MDSSEVLLEALFWTLGFGSISVSLNYLLFKKLFCAATMYWVGWAFLLFGSLEAQRNGWYSISTRHFDLIVVSHTAAFFGHVAASLVAAIALLRTRRSRSHFISFSESSEILLSKYFNVLLVAIFTLGVVNFLFKTGGANIDLGALRTQYNLREESLIERIGNHLTNLVAVFVILSAVRDSHSNLKLSKLVILVLVVAPFNLANATRLFLVTFPAIYMCSFLLSRAEFARGRLLRPGEGIKISLLASLFLVIFAVMGFIRGGYGEELDVYRTILVWPVSTAWAFDEWVEIAMRQDRTYGLVFFGLLGSYGDLIGLFDLSSARDVIRGIYTDFEVQWSTVAVIPRSIIPEIVLDFGVDGIFPVMFLYSFCAQFVSLTWSGRSAFQHSVATIAVWSSFTTIQMAPFSPGNVALLFWACVLSFFMKRSKMIEYHVTRPQEAGAAFVLGRRQK